MNKSFLSDKLYDVLKWCAMLLLPALAIFVKAVFGVWNIPYGDQISTTILALDVFLSSILGISSIQYRSGDEV